MLADFPSWRAKKYSVKVKKQRNGFEVYFNGKRVKRIRYRSGGYRFVGFVGNMVLKIDLYASGGSSHTFFFQTRDEIKTYRLASRTKKRYLPKMVAYGKVEVPYPYDDEDNGTFLVSWLLQERVEEDKESQRNWDRLTEDQQRAISRKLRHLFRDSTNDVSFFSPGSYSNWFLTTKGPVVFDYAV